LLNINLIDNSRDMVQRLSKKKRKKNTLREKWFMTLIT